jgi:signal transduction histidine kinase/streptogramin lyase/ActR/RegA family two-component response regulator
LALLAGLILQAALAASAAASTPLPLPWAEPSFRTYGLAEGLPSSNIDVLALDHDGYLWISTESGLVRYGGSGFRVWRHDPRDPNSISGTTLATLFVDDHGQLWGGSQDGLVRYDSSRENFRHWHHDAANPSSPASDDVTALAGGPDGSLWIGYFNAGLDRLHEDGRSFEHLRHRADDPDSLVSNVVYSLLAEADGSLWIGASGGLDRRLPDGRIQHIPFDRPADAYRDKLLRIYRLTRVGDTLLIATNYGLYGLGPGGRATLVAPDELPRQAVFSAVADQHGRLWVGTNNGVYLRDSGGHFRHIEARPLLRHGLPDAYTYNLLLDHEGGLWVGTLAGLGYLPPDWTDFRFYAHKPETPDSLGLGAYSGVATSADDHVWVAGKNGALDRLDLATGKAEHLPFQMPQGRNIYSMAEDARGRLWFSAVSGTYLLDHGKVTELKAPKPERILFGDDGTAYFQLSDGVVAVAPDGEHMRPLQLEEQAGPISLNDARWYDHALWIASDDGLLRWAPGDARAHLVPGLRPGPVSAIDQCGQDLWVLDEENLSHYRLDGSQASLLASYSLYQQHPLADVLAMHCDENDRVWFFARSGLWRYDTNTGKLREFGLEQGLPDGEFTDTGIVRTPSGHLYAATKSGIVGFLPEAVKEQPRVPRVRLEAVTMRRDGHVQPLAGEHGQWRLAWNDRDLTVTAAALSYVAPERNRYRFRLDGLDADWVGTEQRPDRSFTQLPGGDYRLRVQAAGPDGVWGELPQPLRLHVDTAPWLRWWAWLTYTVLLGLIFVVVLLAMRRRQRQRMQLELVTQQHRLAQTASEAKTRFLAELGHEIRTPMTGVLGMAELLLSRPLEATERRYVQTIRRSGEVLLTLVNDALDLARIEAGRLQLAPAPFDPRALLNDVAELQRGRAVAKGLSLHADVHGAVPALVLGDAVRIKQILLNLSGNALKFTEHGEVRLCLDQQLEGLRYTVSDTGPGIAPADQARLFKRYEQLDSPQRGSGSGLGLAICRELAALMDGTVTLESTPGEGSTFHLVLPLPAVAGDDDERPRPDEPDTGPVWRLLLLEDDPIVAAVVVGLLEAQGHTVSHAPNGLRALEWLEVQRYDAALVDLDLPGLDGFQWARLVRSREKNGERLPMVAVTARSGGDEETQARAAGMDGFLRKPLQGEQLARALAAQIRTARVS